jgi:hypothetical protein
LAALGSGSNGCEESIDALEALLVHSGDPPMICIAVASCPEGHPVGDVRGEGEIASPPR